MRTSKRGFNFKLSQGLVLGAALILGAAQASAAQKCRTVHGTFSLIPLPASTCPPIGICGEGTFAGGLRGDYYSPFLSVDQTPETPKNGIVLFTAETLISNAKVGHWRGDLLLTETGTLNTTGKGQFAELFAVKSGTGDFAGATGVLKSTGNFVPVVGGDAVYYGEICVNK